MSGQIYDDRQWVYVNGQWVFTNAFNSAAQSHYVAPIQQAYPYPQGYYPQQQFAPVDPRQTQMGHQRAPDHQVLAQFAASQMQQRIGGKVQKRRSNAATISIPTRGIGYWMNHPLVKLIAGLIVIAISFVVFVSIMGGHRYR